MPILLPGKLSRTPLGVSQTSNRHYSGEGLPWSLVRMNPDTLRDRLRFVLSKRESLLQLLEQPDLGTLRIDVNQALEELDELLAEVQRTFPDLES